jgi:hypothetical protein
MLLASVFAWMVCVVAFVSEGCSPFSMPISLLGDSRHLGAYRAVVVSLVIVALLFVGVRCGWGTASCCR